jgi:hypothetical protein
VTHAIVWRRIDKPGHEYCRLQQVDGGARLTGVAVLSSDNAPHCVEYEIHCDTSWRTLRCRLAENSTSVRTDWEIRREGEQWLMNGVEVPAVAGCEDIDLGFSPATNLLPIRRLNLKVGETAGVRAAWVRFPEFSLELLVQSYTRVSEDVYRYESAGGKFTRELKVDENGFVLEYPDIWQAESISGS